MKAPAGVLLERMILQRTRAQSLRDVRSLSLWGYDLEDVSVVSQLPNAETLSLPINKIGSLAPFSQCYSLRHLFLRQNQISDVAELNHLRGLSHLQTLSLIENPITQHPHYREIAIRTLPQLQLLDDVPVSRSDAEVPRQEAAPARKRRHEEIRGEDERDAHFLTAVLALIPELTSESLQIVLDAIEQAID